jgi:FMN phosphatase YigB (HAD superfamily)
MPRIEAVIFDLDNTLYDERTYFEAAFHKIADSLAGKCSLSQNEIFDKLTADLRKKGTMYTHLFNDALADLGLDKEVLGKVLELFATVNVSLVPYPETIPFY